MIEWISKYLKLACFHSNLDPYIFFKEYHLPLTVVYLMLILGLIAWKILQKILLLNLGEPQSYYCYQFNSFSLKPSMWQYIYINADIGSRSEVHVQVREKKVQMLMEDRQNLKVFGLSQNLGSKYFCWKTVSVIFLIMANMNI